jgi:hypothetical protein
MQAIAYKLSLWLSTLFLNSPPTKGLNGHSDWKCWAWYINRLDYANDVQEIRASRKWVHKNCSFRVETACFIVYFAMREPLTFLLALVFGITGPVYLSYFVVTELLARFGIGG